MFQVFEADNGVSALKVLEENEDIKVLVTDYNMPVMDGFELTTKVRKNYSNKKITILGLSGQEDPTLTVKFIKNGADDFITKPFQEEEFICRISRNVESISLFEDVQDKMEQIKTAYNIMEKDLKAAENLQKSHLPDQYFKSSTVEFGSMFIPSAFVSGDFYNYFELRNNLNAFYSVDVSGHGVPAALLSVSLATLITPDYIQGFVDRFFEKNGKKGSLGEISIEIVNSLNDRFQIDDDISQYFTIAFGLVDGESGEIGFCQAGHPSPILLRTSGEVEILGKGGVPVGFLKTQNLKEVIISYTLGIGFSFIQMG